MSGQTHQHGAKDPECVRVFEALSEYLDGELSAEDCHQIEEHMQGCEPCIDFLESLKSSIAASRSIAAPKAPVTMPAEIREKLLGAWQAALERKRSLPDTAA